MRKVFLEDLPRWGNGRHKGQINWKECVGYKINFVYDDIEGEINIKDICGEKLTMEYNDYIYHGRIDTLTKCKLKGLLKLKTNEYLISIGTVFNDKTRNITITDKTYSKGNKKSYKFYCNKCGYEGEIREDALLGQGQGCPCCCPNPRIVVQGINDIPTTAPWMVKYFQGGYDEAKIYNKSSGVRIRPICPDCGEIKNKDMRIADIYRLKSICCKCNDKISIPEKIMYNILNQLGIEFIFQLTKKELKWCNKFKYDFYIPSLDTIIETHGMQHYKDCNWSEYSKQHNNDLEKHSLADNNGIKNYIIVDCRYSDIGYIKNNILNSKLGEMFDLTVINWKACEEFIYKNLIKDICEYWSNKEYYETTKELSEVFNLTNTCIQNYLKQGTKLGWCKYNPEEVKKNAYKNGKKNSKAINIFKDGDFIYTCVSATEFAKISQDIIGIKCTQSGINASILNNKDHKGFTFKYVEPN